MPYKWKKCTNTQKQTEKANKVFKLMITLAYVKQDIYTVYRISFCFINFPLSKSKPWPNYCKINLFKIYFLICNSFQEIKSCSTFNIPNGHFVK